MLFMKEKREEVGIQFNLKDSAAINKVLGQMVRQKDGHNLILSLILHSGANLIKQSKTSITKRLEKREQSIF